LQLQSLQLRTVSQSLLLRLPRWSQRDCDAEHRRMQDELSKLRREKLRRQTYSFRDSRSPVSASDTATQNSLQQSAYRHRQNEHERVVSEMQHLQQEVARLRQERDAARMQRGDTAAKQALNKRPGGERSCFDALELS